MTTCYLNERDPQCPARPQTFIGPDLVGELDILDCDVVPAIEKGVTSQETGHSHLIERPARVSPSKTVWSVKEVQQELPEEHVP